MKTSSNMRFMSALVLGLMFFANVAFAQATSIEGIWKGRGMLTLYAGQRERIVCKVTYRKAGQGYGVDAKCSVAGTNFKRSGGVKRISALDNKYYGLFFDSNAKPIGEIWLFVTESGTMVVIGTNPKGRLDLVLKKLR